MVGHGHMGRFHARALRDLGFDVDTVDPHAPATHRAVPDLAPYTAAAVATPVEHLALHGLACARAGLRTLIEKPAGTNLEEVELLARLLDGMPVCVGFIERFNPRVRRLKDRLAVIGRPMLATFTRWNERPSNDPLVDLRIHDVDLAHHLGLECEVVFDTRADAPMKRRLITVAGTRGSLTADLMDHDTSPLHALWHNFLGGGEPTPDLWDAVAAHRALREPPERLAA